MLRFETRKPQFKKVVCTCTDTSLTMSYVSVSQTNKYQPLVLCALREIVGGPMIDALAHSEFGKEEGCGWHLTESSISTP